MNADHETRLLHLHRILTTRCVVRYALFRGGEGNTFSAHIISAPGELGQFEYLQHAAFTGDVSNHSLRTQFFNKTEAKQGLRDIYSEWSAFAGRNCVVNAWLAPVEFAGCVRAKIAQGHHLEQERFTRGEPQFLFYTAKLSEMIAAYAYRLKALPLTHPSAVMESSAFTRLSRQFQQFAQQELTAFYQRYDKNVRMQELVEE